MLFNSLEFVTFFAVVFVAYWAVVRWAWASLSVLLLASLLFYACWNPLYLGLIVASSLVDFMVGGKLYRTESPRARKALLLTSLTYNLGILAIFKYFNFFMDQMAWLDQVLVAQGWLDGPLLSGLKVDLLLPVGISFFTFQSMSYTIDIYRRELEPVDVIEDPPAQEVLSEGEKRSSEGAREAGKPTPEQAPETAPPDERWRSQPQHSQAQVLPEQHHRSREHRSPEGEKRSSEGARDVGEQAPDTAPPDERWRSQPQHSQAQVLPEQHHRSREHRSPEGEKRSSEGAREAGKPRMLQRTRQRSWWDPRYFARYLLFVSFFPQLVAGPIVRARDLLPQLRDRPPVTDAMAGRGLYLVLLGLFKKIVIADFLALNLVDRTFTMADGFSSFEVLVGVYGYAFQIYCDFSGYSDIAIGTALLLGFTFPDNFNAPYIARNLQDFWHRWHISLSSWLRDYLYISLGGNRGGSYKTYRNLMLTMLLGGLWHGAGWNFIIWGLLHGVALAVLRAWQRARKAVGLGDLFQGFHGRILAGLITFHYVCFAWIFFRAADFDQAVGILSRLGDLSFETTNLTWQIWAVLGVAAATHLVPRGAFDRVVRVFSLIPSYGQAFIAVAVGLGFKQVISADAVPFIYFQF